MDPDKLTGAAKEKFESAGVTLRDYDGIEAVLRELDASARLLLVPRHISHRLAKACEHCVKIDARAIVTDLKAIKNATELSHLKQAMLDDGAAMVKLFVWLYRSLRDGAEVSELQASRPGSKRKTTPWFSAA